MLSGMLRKFMAIALLALPVIAFSKDCVVVPAVSLCGVPLKASQATFEKAFGEPDGRIHMGRDRVGLLYGINFVVIFWHGKVWEIQNWARRDERGPTDWFGYVGYGRKDRETRVVFQKWNPWSEPVPNDKTARLEMPSVTGDEYSDIRKIRGGSVFILYGVQEIGDRREPSENVTYMQVSFNGEPVAP